MLLGLLVVLPIALLNILEFMSEVSGSNAFMQCPWFSPGSCTERPCNCRRVCALLTILDLREKGRGSSS